MSIAEAIKKIAGKQAVADLGKVISVNEEKETCSVEIAGMDDVVEGVRLSVAGKNELGLLIVPKEGTDVAVVWVNGVLPVVVAVAEPEKVMWRGEDFFEKMNEFINDYKSHTHELTPSLTAPNGPVTGTISVAKPSSSVEEFEL
jgi:hypothetical protein